MFAVSADAAPDACGMSGENGSGLRESVFDVEESHAGCPFVEVCDYAGAGWEAFICTKAFDYKGGGMTESTSFGIIAIGVEGVNAVELPHFGEQFGVLGVYGVEFDEYGDWASGDVPTTDANGNSEREVGVLLPLGEY